MNKRFIIIFLILLGSLSTFAQLEQNSAPVKWELYRVSAKNVSLLLPKMPVLISSSNNCLQLEIDKYAVYANDVIHGLNIYSKSNKKIPDYCSIKRQFDEDSFRYRVNEIKNELYASDSKKILINELELEFIKGKLFNYWLVNDFKNNQWVELWTANSDENTKEVKEFINSLKFAGQPEGIEINKGSDSTLGDLTIKAEETKLPEKSVNEPESKLTKILFIIKPQPIYTDLARKNEVSGTVLLRVTFLANGAIGSISPVSSLGNGLTEQAIIAAKKIVFIPAKRNGSNISMTMSVQYVFTIY